MRQTIRHYFVAVVLCILTERYAASYCYPDYCQNLTELIPVPGYQCLLTRVQRGEGCAKLKFDDADEGSSKQDGTAIFTLRAYTMPLYSEKTTAFNLSVTNIDFHRLITRYQNIVDGSQNACRHIELYGNSSHPAPKELYVSCPFSLFTYEGLPYRLEYFVAGKTFAYSRKYVFYVPQHIYIEDGIEIEKFTPFIYLDVTDPSNLALYVQPLPPRYNVTKYKVCLIHNETEWTIDTVIPANKNGAHMRYNFTAPDGVYYVKVAALHADCGEYGCANSTSPYIRIKQTSDRLLIVIISMIWIPPVLLYAAYHALKLYRKKADWKMKSLNCLLVYSPTHEAHVKVMAELTKYLQSCNINAMIDVFSIREIETLDPGIWCNQAFRAADVVLIATSPPSAVCPSIIVYRNTDKHLLRLMKENYPHADKRYYAVHLPYCKTDDIPEEARVLKKFRLPEDLRKLVKTIHCNNYLRFRPSSDKELLDSIKTASKTLEEKASDKKGTEDTEDLLSSIVMQNTRRHWPAEFRNSEYQTGYDTIHKPDADDVVPQSFMVYIDELDLLGETDRTESDILRPPALETIRFHVDELKL